MTQRTTEDYANGRDLSDLLTIIMPFLVWAEADSAMYSMTTATEVLDAFRELLGYDEETFEKLKDIMRGDFD